MYQFTKTIGVSQDTGTGYTMGTPVAISKDSAGNYFVADLANNRVLKLNSSLRKIDVLEGIDMPLFVYVDNDDNVLVNELATHKIKKYTNTFSFIREWGGHGDEDGLFEIPRSIVQDSRGNYYVSDELNHCIQKFDIDGNFLARYGSYGTADGQFAVEQGLSIDAQDRLYVADTYNSRIQVFATYPEWQHVFSYGEHGVYNPLDPWNYQERIFNRPRGVFVEKSSGRVCVADSGNNRIMVYGSIDSGFPVQQIQTATFTMALPPHAILENGRVTCVDSYNRILKYSSTLSNTSLYASHGTLRTQQGIFAGPQSCAVSPTDGDVYITDSFNHRICRFSADGDWKESYGYLNGAGGPTANSNLQYYHFSFPKQVNTDSLGRLYVADFGNSRVVVKSGASYLTFAPVAGVANTVFAPWGVAVDEDNVTLYITDAYDDRVKIIRGGILIGAFGGTGTAYGKFQGINEIQIGVYKGYKAILVGDTRNNRVQAFSPDGEFMGAIGEPSIDPIAEYSKYSDGELFLPIGLCVDPYNNIIVADTSHKRVQVFNSDGEFISGFGKMSNTPGNFFAPIGGAVNQNTGRYYVADSVTQRVSLFDPESAI